MIRTAQPLGAIGINPNHPIFAGSAAQIICYGDQNGFLRNFGNVIPQPTANGTLATGTTDIGNALKFDGTSTYLDFGVLNVAEEFTVFWGGVFDALASVTGIVDCSDGTTSGWSIFTSGTDLFLSGNRWQGNLISSGWATGQFYHAAARNKTGTGYAIFRNGAQIAGDSSSLGSSVANPVNNFWVGQLRVSNPKFITARLSYFYMIDKYLSDDLIKMIFDNPWQILEEEPEVYYYPTASIPPVGSKIPVFANHYRNMGIM